MGYFNPLELQRFNSNAPHNFLDDPLQRRAKDIIDHVNILIDKATEAQNFSKGAQELRENAFRLFRMSANSGGHNYQNLREILPSMMEKLRVILYGDTFRRGISKPVYSEYIFSEVEILIEREMELLRVQELRVTPNDYRLQQLLYDFLEIYRHDDITRIFWSYESYLKDDPGRPYILQMASLRDAVFLERTQEVSVDFFKTLIESPLLEGKAGAEELRENAQLLAEELEVEALWERLAKA